MKLTHLHIKNFKSCKDISLNIGDMHALVGANNSGKSTVLRALEFLFNPSSKSLNKDSFWNNDTSQEIRVEAVFSELTDKEKETLNAYLNTDGTFHMARSARLGGKSSDSESEAEEDDDKIGIGQHYKKPVPEVEWLQESKITGKNITEWWNDRDKLAINGVLFTDGITKKPGVDEWKDKAREFLKANQNVIPMQDTWIDNPRGYANVLKGTLPFFVLVPAVRDVTEESKGTKSSPFGKLLYAILESVSAEKKTKIESILNDLAKQMNRTGGEERVPLIAQTEKQLNTLLNDFFNGCDLEIEFETPTLEVLLSAPKLIVDDGFRNMIENKGHGLQRAVIFTILRRYAEHMTFTPDGKKRNLILAVEEPELYMHPQAQRTIRRVFRKMVEGNDQIIFSTHSSLLVDVAYFDEIIRMESRCEQTDGTKTMVSNAWQLPMVRMIEDLENRFPTLKNKVTSESLRDRYSHAYNPRRNEGFFASKIILVEGLTEEYSLPVYADAITDCAFDPNGIGVVESGGKDSMDRLFRIFNEFHIPCFMLFDYDDGNKDRKITEKSKELLTLMGIKPDVPQSLLVEEGIACFVKSWESDLRSEIPDVDQLSAKAREELGLKDDSGKPLIARYIAQELTTRNPPIIPVSIKKIIEKAVSVKWAKSCLSAPAIDLTNAPTGMKNKEA